MEKKEKIRSPNLLAVNKNLDAPKLILLAPFDNESTIN
jgi:hypothetical protein